MEPSDLRILLLPRAKPELLSALRARHAGLADLARDATEPNVFYEPWMLAAAIANLAGDANLRVAIVEDAAGEAHGLFPIELKPSYKRLPVRHARMWQHRHCYLCTPLVRRGREAAVLKAFVDWSRREPGFPRLFVWNWLGGDGPIFAELVQRVRTEGYPSATESFARAVLERPGTDAETYIASVLSGSHRRDFRRLERRLAETGAFAFKSLAPGEDPEAWLREFLALEAGGWKGRNGTAMDSTAEDRAFFSECIHEAAKRGQLQTLTAELGGKMIAARSNFRSGDACFSFKIAFDEAHAKSRPGLLLEVQHLREIIDLHPEIRVVDYCADPGHPMIDRLSEKRRQIVSLAVALRGIPEGVAVTLAPRVQAAQGALRARWERWRGGRRAAVAPTRTPEAGTEPGASRAPESDV